MKICIVGAGAIGGIIGARLAAAGEAQVSALARGATLAALREHGWRLRMGDTSIQKPVHASDDARDLGAQDLVIVAVKGPALAAVAQAIGPLLGARTVVLPAMNGVPWWFGFGVHALGNAPLESVDPGGRIAQAIELGRIVGCVVHLSAAVPAPGLVQHKMGNGLIIGEPGGEIEGKASERVRRIGDLLGDAGFEVTLSPSIRRDIWYKLWGNMTMNPISALTGATADRVLDDALVRTLCTSAMAEASAIGARIGCAISQTPEERHLITRKLGAFKTSMLQDVEAGRTLELDGIVTVVHELGRRTGVPTPHIDAILGLTRLFGRIRGLYPEAPA
ncbi:MAG TPA: 2-dehydropantoate 2-reductase [Burkholderiaceae bacterium]|nr:2-dehydropantoate 2-reductase [Burkholderiaceae bacterium]